jgi:hypothetical protein
MRRYQRDSSGPFETRLVHVWLVSSLVYPVSWPASVTVNHLVFAFSSVVRLRSLAFGGVVRLS